MERQFLHTFGVMGQKTPYSGQLPNFKGVLKNSDRNDLTQSYTGANRSHSHMKSGRIGSSRIGEISVPVGPGFFKYLNAGNHWIGNPAKLKEG